MQNIKEYSKREEKANYLTHFLGVLMALAAIVVLLNKSIVAGNVWATVAYAIYGFGMLACMLSSTIYHYAREPKRKAVLRHFDHASIYVLIASTYSPFTLILLRNEGLWGSVAGIHVGDARDERGAQHGQRRPRPASLLETLQVARPGVRGGLRVQTGGDRDGLGGRRLRVGRRRHAATSTRIARASAPPSTCVAVSKRANTGPPNGWRSTTSSATPGEMPRSPR